MRRTTKFSGLMAALAAFSLLFSGMALADDVIADGDGAVPIVSSHMTFGAVCQSASVDKDALLALKKGGNEKNSFAHNQSVSVSVQGVTGAGYSAAIVGDSSITLPSTYEAIDNGNLFTDDTVTSSVTYVGQNGSSSGVVTFAVTGKNEEGAALTRTTTMNVSASLKTTGCDTTAPTLSLPSNITQEATGASGRVVTYSATATDANPTNPTVTCTPASGSTFAIATTTVNCSATDAAGNTANGSFTVTIRDTTGPTISNMPSNITTEATSGGGAVVNFTNPTASDTVDGARTVTCTPASGSTFPINTTTVTCSAQDTRGNSSSSLFTVTVSDTQAPVLVLPADLTREATSAGGATVSYTASASDVVDGARTVSCTPVSGSTFALGDTTVECSASDSRGNTAAGSFKVSVADTTAPAFDPPVIAAATEATSPAGAAVNYVITSSDAVSGGTAVSCDRASGSTFPLGTTDVNCESTDGAGNRSTTSFAVTVVDTTTPALSLPDDQLIEATSADGAPATFAASAVDSGDATPAVTCDRASGSTFRLGETTVSCRAEDASGNVATGSFKVTVEDTTGPLIDGTPAEFTVEAVSSSGATATYTNPTATDLVDGATTVSCEPASGATFALGSNVVTCSSTDEAGNLSQTMFNVIVSDTTAPVLALPASFSAEAEDADGAEVTYLASASDAVDGDVPVTCAPLSGSVFALGDTLVECEAQDTRGHKATGSFTITVEDTTAPELTVPNNITAEATSADGATVTFTATAIDAVDGDPDVSCGPASGATFPLGTTTVTCTATDAENNESQDTFDVTVEDTTKPALDVPANKTEEATGAGGAAVTYNPSATDLVSGSTAVICLPESGSTFGIGSWTVNCESTDGAGNKAVGSFTVTVEDTTAPALTLPANKTKEATGPDGATASYSPTAEDVVDGSVPVICDPASGSTFALGTTTVNCESTDSANKKASGSFTVTVKDTTGPVINLPADQTLESTNYRGSVVTYAATANDAVDGDTSVSCNPASGTNFPIGETTVSCTSTDTRDNQTSGSFKVTVQYTGPTYQFGGFKAPIDKKPTINRAKAGSAIPVKFSLGGYQGMDIFEKAPTAPSYVCAGGVMDAIEITATAGSSGLTYDAGSDTYTYVWKTTSTMANTCRTLTLHLRDGSTPTALFTFVK